MLFKSTLVVNGFISFFSKILLKYPFCFAINKNPIKEITDKIIRIANIFLKLIIQKRRYYLNKL